MPKRTGPRPGRGRAMPGTSPGGKRSSPRAPRPTASVPVGSAVWGSPPTVEAAPPRAMPAARPSFSERRTYRPARGSSLPMITDYRYVFADLRRIGLLAAGAFIILIILTFFIH